LKRQEEVMANHEVHVTREGDDDQLGPIVRAMLDFLGKVPSSDEPMASDDPLRRAQSLSRIAALKAAGISGGFALPPGPLGMATIVPDLVAIWKLQAQMVADIASTYGKKAYLTKEQMLYCLFKHAAAQAVRDFVVRVGERVLIRRVSLRVFQNAARKVGVKITQRVAGRAISRWLPIVGAVGIGAYAYYDTGNVAATAIELFSNDIDLEGESDAA
jgi:hypothetical protein